MSKKTKEVLEQEKKGREAAIETAQKAYDGFAIAGPDDVQKKFDLYVSLMEAKAANSERNQEDILEAIKEAAEAATAATTKDAETIGTIQAKLDATVAGLEMISARVKHSGRNNKGGNDGAPEAFGDVLMKGLLENEGSLRSMKKGDRVSMDLKVVGDMTFAANFPTADVSVAYLRPGIIELPKRKLHIRQLITGGGMGNKSTFDYVKEVAGEGAIAPVAEGTLKPQIDLDLVEVSSPAQWIAGWLRISRNMLDDVEGMRTFLQSRLPEKLFRIEDDQILNGNGTSPNLSGITDSGNFTAPNSGYTIDVEQLVGAIAQLESLDRDANGILLHPADYYRLWLNKAGGSGEYDQPGLVAIVNGQMYIGGVPVYKSTAMAQDKFIVGDWINGINLITREPARVEFFMEDGINVRENKVTVRIEERIALPIYGSDYFIYGDFSLS